MGHLGKKIRWYTDGHGANINVCTWEVFVFIYVSVCLRISVSPALALFKHVAFTNGIVFWMLSWQCNWWLLNYLHERRAHVCKQATGFIKWSGSQSDDVQQECATGIPHFPRHVEAFLMLQKPYYNGSITLYWHGITFSIVASCPWPCSKIQ